MKAIYEHGSAFKDETIKQMTLKLIKSSVDQKRGYARLKTPYESVLAGKTKFRKEGDLLIWGELSGKQIVNYDGEKTKYLKNPKYNYNINELAPAAFASRAPLNASDVKRFLNNTVYNVDPAFTIDTIVIAGPDSAKQMHSRFVNAPIYHYGSRFVLPLDNDKYIFEEEHNSFKEEKEGKVLYSSLKQGRKPKILELTKDDIQPVTRQYWFNYWGNSAVYDNMNLMPVGKPKQNSTHIQKYTLMLSKKRHQETLLGSNIKKQYMYVYHIKSWKDHSVVDFSEDDINVLFDIYQLYKLNRPDNTVTHCKAGLGRTGTILFAIQIYRHFAAIFTDNEQAKITESLLSDLDTLRKIRPGLLQTDQQLGMAVNLAFSFYKRKVKIFQRSIDWVSEHYKEKSTRNFKKFTEATEYFDAITSRNSVTPHFTLYLAENFVRIMQYLNQDDKLLDQLQYVVKQYEKTYPYNTLLKIHIVEAFYQSLYFVEFYNKKSYDVSQRIKSLEPDAITRLVSKKALKKLSGLAMNTQVTEFSKYKATHNALEKLTKSENIQLLNIIKLIRIMLEFQVGAVLKNKKYKLSEQHFNNLTDIKDDFVNLALNILKNINNKIPRQDIYAIYKMSAFISLSFNILNQNAFSNDSNEKNNKNAVSILRLLSSVFIELISNIAQNEPVKFGKNKQEFIKHATQFNAILNNISNGKNVNQYFGSVISPSIMQDFKTDEEAYASLLLFKMDCKHYMSLYASDKLKNTVSDDVPVMSNK